MPLGSAGRHAHGGRRIRGRVVQGMVLLLVLGHFAARWYLPRWTDRACARREGDPVAVLRDVPWWMWAALNDCDIGDVVVRACWGP